MMRVLTTEKIERAVELRHRSWSIEAIAQELGASTSALRWQLLKLGEVDPPKPSHQPPRVPSEPTAVACKGGKVRRLFTVSEDAELRALRRQGLGVSEIARRMGRGHTSIIGRLLTLSHHDIRAERVASPAGEG